MWGGQVLLFDCMKFCCECGQERIKSRYEAEHPDQLILYPVQELIITDTDNKNRLQKMNQTDTYKMLTNWTCKIRIRNLGSLRQ